MTARSQMQVLFKRIRADAILPTYGSQAAAGADLYVPRDAEPIVIAPHTTVMIPLGFSIALPDGYAGLIFARSGLASKRSLAPANKVGVVDPDYRGECMIALHNHGDTPQPVDAGERIAQMVITPFLHASFLEVEALDETARGAGGFGSTGTH